jgi:uncharacterized circularly permuted ATP-grasp superfamily protein/uncharacterized alpha-E superfamily protein
MNPPVSTEESTEPNHSFSRYRPEPGIYDEMAEAPGKHRPHWQKLVQGIASLDAEDLKQRWQQARLLIREHGITYNIYGDPQGTARPWELDPAPLLIPPADWSRIEAGLAQRARLFNLILADLYGPQQLLREGILPGALLFANPRYLRACHNVDTPADVRIHLHASDLARSAKGEWWVLSDRTQAPSGGGYALENRMVLSRVFPEQFREQHIRRLAPFFRLVRDNLRALALRNRDNPNVVLLTPGPFNETYFEHAYLARYLGITLVEGGDLTVRGRCVYIKTLAGLQPVDVILRRVDDWFCDPLELREDSCLGIPGLIEAVRAGTVTVANAIGAGLMESPAFLAFLPSLCRFLLHEDLLLPSVATWWCGQEKERKYVIEHLDQIVVKPAFGTREHKPYFGRQMSRKERESLIEAIEAHPYGFVGQEQFELSTTPVWRETIEPRPLVFRGFVATGAETSTVMPGGLARVSPAIGKPVVSMQAGGGSKDVWVLSNEPVSRAALINPSTAQDQAFRSSGEVPSRVADHLYWLGRYSERLECLSRLLRCVISRVADETATEPSAELASLARMLAIMDRFPRRFLETRPVKEVEQEILLIIYKPDRRTGIHELLGQVRGVASVVRDRCSADTWSILSMLEIGDPSRASPTEALRQLNTLIVDLAAFSGMEMENMTRGLGWRFLDYGRRLERGMHIAELLRAAISKDIRPHPVLEAVLEIADSAMTYRRRFFSGAQLPSVLELLLMDGANPRSLVFQLESIANHVANLPEDPQSPNHGAIKKRAQALLDRVKRVRAWELAQAWEHGASDPIDQLLSDIIVDLGLLSNQLSHHYFSHTMPRAS